MEFELIRWLGRKYGLPRAVGIGIGDDAAVIRTGPGPSIVTTDVIVDGVDFLSAEVPARLIGRKALAVNLSDAAAMGARPSGFTIALGLPRKTTAAWVKKFYSGMMALAAEFGVSCLGGDFTASPVLFASVTLLGSMENRPAVLRSGATPGHFIGVTGSLGGSILGRHASFTPRVREGMFLAGRARAMLDISDGFAQDLEHLLSASGCSAEIELGRIPVSGDARKLAKGNTAKALEHALSDGEDFELLFTVAAQSRNILDRIWKEKFPRTPLSWVGRVIKKERRPVVWLKNGSRAAGFYLERKGYSHF